MKIKVPTLLVDKEKVLRNIKRITEKASETSTKVIPHFKTHQSLEVGNWFRAFGIDEITVSSVIMAKYFAKGGWDKIYIAFPVNIAEIDDIAQLAAKINLTVLINNIAQLEALIKSVNDSVAIKIEVDCGGKRSGIPSGKPDEIESLIKGIVSSHHQFDGFYSHFGHTYAAKNAKEVSEIFNKSFKELENLKEKFEDYKPKISLGDTPSASVLADYSGIDSIHAGNYVFYDLTQSQIGVCSEDDIAIALAVPIVAKNKDRKELVVYGGGVHLSKESLHNREFNSSIYGKIAVLKPNGWKGSFDGCYLSSISQEHGVVKVSDEVYDRFNVGDAVAILPVHSCMTADVMRGYIDADEHIIDHLKGLSFAAFI